MEIGFCNHPRSRAPPSPSELSSWDCSVCTHSKNTMRSSIMRNKWLSIAALFFIFASAAGSQAREDWRFFWRAERATAPQQLELRTEHGTCTLRLFVQQDGPVRIPLSSGRYSAVLISTQLAVDRVHVTLAGEERGQPDGGTFPLGQYEFSAEEPALSWLPDELRMKGVGILNMKLVPLTKSTCAGCDCGTLCCKPDPGQCIGCGSCGDCCRMAT